MQPKGRRNVWLLCEAKHQPKQPEARREWCDLHPVPFIHSRRMLSRDLQEHDVLMHDPVVLNVEGQSCRHDVRLFRKVNGGALHALGRAGLIKTGDEGCQTNGVLVPPFEGDAPAFPPNEHKSERNEHRREAETSLRREFCEHWLIRR